MRARLAELNVQIDALDIAIKQMKTIAQLNYFFIESSAINNGVQSGENDD